ncbi:unnamed protein product, partial [Rodentolepis nana]|uniref:Uncharacterized protein n=1 Tax=Rodentolepis nana TaxID=102285 RepID=A0A0R3TIS5_RODNA
MNTTRPQGEGFLKSKGRRRTSRNNNRGRVSGAISQQSCVTPSAIGVTSNDTNAIENAFEELTGRIPRLYTIATTVDPTKREKVFEYQQILDKDLESVNSAENKYFFITCSFTSWNLFLFELLNCVKEEKDQVENIEFIKETYEQFKSLLSMHVSTRTRIIKNPYRNMNSENVSESSKNDNAKSDSESSETVVAEENDGKELGLEENEA